MGSWQGQTGPPQVHALLQVWGAHRSPLWPRRSRCWWTGSSRHWWSAWSSMLHPQALGAPSGSQLAMAAPWMLSPTALPQRLTAPGLAWLSSLCPPRSWQPGKTWSATQGLRLVTAARAHGPYSCQVGTELGPLWMLPAHTLWKQDMLGDRAGSHGGHGGCPCANSPNEAMPGFGAGWPQGPESWVCNSFKYPGLKYLLQIQVLRHDLQELITLPPSYYLGLVSRFM